MGGAYLRFRADEALTYAAVYLDLPASTAMMRLMNANRILVYEVHKIIFVCDLSTYHSAVWCEFTGFDIWRLC